MTDHLRFQLNGRDDELSAESFLRSSMRILDTLSELAKDRGKKPGKWKVISVEMNSPLAQVWEGEGTDARAFFNGMRRLEREAVFPEEFTRSSLRRAKQAADCLSNGVLSYVLGYEGEICVITQQCGLNIAAVLGPELSQVRAVTSLEGRLEAIDLHTSKAQCSIYDILTDKKTRCEFQDGLKDKVKELLESRVLVTGDAFYDEGGHPTKIVVTCIEPVDDTPPSPCDLANLRLLPSGEDSADYVRQVRHGE